jgi:hypothetical protein
MKGAYMKDGHAGLKRYMLEQASGVRDDLGARAVQLAL